MCRVLACVWGSQLAVSAVAAVSAVSTLAIPNHPPTIAIVGVVRGACYSGEMTGFCSKSTCP
eukprot:3460048-Prymnesium_polylepis.1